MNLLPGQEQRRRQKEQTGGHKGGRGGWMNWKKKKKEQQSDECRDQLNLTAKYLILQLLKNQYKLKKLLLALGNAVCALLDQRYIYTHPK